MHLARAKKEKGSDYPTSSRRTSFRTAAVTVFVCVCVGMLMIVLRTLVSAGPLSQSRALLVGRRLGRRNSQCPPWLSSGLAAIYCSRGCAPVSACEVCDPLLQQPEEDLRIGHRQGCFASQNNGRSTRERKMEIDLGSFFHKPTFYPCQKNTWSNSALHAAAPGHCRFCAGLSQFSARLA